jgi:hypothetical protein
MGSRRSLGAPFPVELGLSCLAFASFHWAVEVQTALNHFLRQDWRSFEPSCCSAAALAEYLAFLLLLVRLDNLLLQVMRNLFVVVERH